MTDRELLELAAKAAELDDAEWIEDQQHINYEVTNRKHFRRRRWSPLTDDGDALRLAVKLCIDIEHNHPADQQRWTAADRSGCEGCYGPVSCVEDDFEDESDRSAATRRAIVRAAAEIGRSMK